MSKSARSVFVFSLYLFVLGIILVVIPNNLLDIFSGSSGTSYSPLVKHKIDKFKK
jgi:hypothetical protein